MCFSPQADLVGGLVISAIGLDAVGHVRQRRELIAIAWLPLLLGAHQLIEAVVWLWLQGHLPSGAGHLALRAYLLIALVALPALVPLAVIALEPTRHRKLLMTPFAVTGTVTAAILLTAMTRGPIAARLAPYHLAYSVRLHDGLLITALYVLAVCGPLLLSGYRHVALFGIINLIAVILIARLTADGFASIWCGWAALSSAAIALHIRLARPHPAAAWDHA